MAPSLAWIEPVANDKTYDARLGKIGLRVKATDNGGIGWVDFMLFDKEARDWVHIDSDRTAPYQASIHSAALYCFTRSR